MSIDKDLEILKENIDDGTIYVRCGFTLNQAIENVLSEFQGLRDFSTETVIRNAELQVELETYKKIAEKLAEKLNQAYFEENVFLLFFEKEILKGIQADYGYVGDVIIDWARKEVEKDD